MTEFKKFVDIETLGKSENSCIVTNAEDGIIIEEKVDGGNGSFWVEDGELHVGSRHHDLTLEKDVRTFTKERAELLKILDGKLELINKNYIYYVEWMQKHTVNYNGGITAVVGLDIRLKPLTEDEPSKFLFYNDKVNEFSKLGVPIVALKWSGLAKDVNEALLKTLLAKSLYYDGLPEGIVVKNYGRTNKYGRQIFAKIVNDNFQEHSKSRTNKIRPSDDSELLINTFVTEARVNKRILSLITEGKQDLGLALMTHLPISVIKDIFKEESEWMLKNCKVINFATIKHIASAKCVAFLKAFIEKQALDKGNI